MGFRAVARGLRTACGPTPRYALAGIFLLVAALARQETFLFLAVATAHLTLRVVRGPRPERSVGLILVGWFALVVLAIHDVLLTGDPLWWTKVASISAASRNVTSVGGVARLNATHLAMLWPLVAVGIVGAVVLVRRRSWFAFWGLATMGPLVALFTLVLAWRHLSILGHYLHPIDLAVILAAAVGVGTILAELLRRAVPLLPGALHDRMPAIGVASAALIAVALSSPFAPTSAAARQAVGAQAAAAVRVDAVVPILQQAPPRPPGPAFTPSRVRMPRRIPRMSSCSHLATR